MTSPTRFRELRKKAARVTGAHHAFSPRKRPAPDLEREASVPGTSPDFLGEEPEGETKMDPDFDAEEALKGVLRLARALDDPPPGRVVVARAGEAGDVDDAVAGTAAVMSTFAAVFFWYVYNFTGFGISGRFFFFYFF